MTQDILSLVLLLVLASAWTTEWIGIHALFGAFLFGAILPKDKGFVHDLTGKLEDFVVVFLLPIFFAYTGLRTSIGLLWSRRWRLRASSEVRRSPRG
jgi:Kef-type K+ transport system membrane component KefB